MVPLLDIMTSANIRNPLLSVHWKFILLPLREVEIENLKKSRKTN